MAYTIKGKGTLNLTKRDFLASGGEGSVYVKGNTAFKIYTDIRKTIPEGKINELSAIQIPNVIKPMDIIVDNTGVNCGYSMQYVNKDDVFVLCELFPKAFKERNQLTMDKVVALVKKFRETIKHCHTKDILLVDINEMNFLIPKTYNDFYFIDTDSYQTPSYKATAIMDSIRDRHCKNNAFTENTDWFSFGVVSFNMFTGIHPFKGKHTIYKNLDNRMEHNISVLNKDVSYPAMLGDITQLIPQNYLEWYKEVFENGKRIAPPTGDISTMAVARKIQIIKGSDNFITKEVFKAEHNLNTIIEYIDDKNMLTTDGFILNGKMDTKVAPYAEIVKTPKTNHTLSFIVSKDKLMCYDISTGKNIDLDIYASDLMKYDNRIFVKQHDNICEVGFIENGSIIPFIKPVANVIELSAHMFAGCAIQNLLGSYHVSVFPQKGIHYQAHIKEIDNHRIINAKHDNHILMIVSELAGVFYKTMFKFSDKYDAYSVIQHNNINELDLNFVVLDNGICISVTDDGYVSVMHNNVSNHQIRIIQDSMFDGNQLFKQNNNVFYTAGDTVFSVKMK